MQGFRQRCSDSRQWTQRTRRKQRPGTATVSTEPMRRHLARKEGQWVQQSCKLRFATRPGNNSSLQHRIHPNKQRTQHRCAVKKRKFTTRGLSPTKSSARRTLQLVSIGYWASMLEIGRRTAAVRVDVDVDFEFWPWPCIPVRPKDVRADTMTSAVINCKSVSSKPTSRLQLSITLAARFAQQQ